MVREKESLDMQTAFTLTTPFRIRASCWTCHHLTSLLLSSLTGPANQWCLQSGDWCCSWCGSRHWIGRALHHHPVHTQANPDPPCQLGYPLRYVHLANSSHGYIMSSWSSYPVPMQFSAPVPFSPALHSWNICNAPLLLHCYVLTVWQPEILPKCIVCWILIMLYSYERHRSPAKGKEKIGGNLIMEGL